MKKRVCIMARVSKQSGNYQRQVDELVQYANDKNYDIVEIITEKISGGVKNDERPDIIRLKELVKENAIDKVLIWEPSRLSRRSVEAAKLLEFLIDNNVSLFIKNYNIETLDENGNVVPIAKFMIGILNEFSENERLNIKMRLQSGYNKYRSRGGSVGRKTGSNESKDTFLEKHNNAVKLLKKGISIRNVAQLTGKSTKTVQKVKNWL